jgi:hypothetical protein
MNMYAHTCISSYLSISHWQIDISCAAGGPEQPELHKGLGEFEFGFTLYKSDAPTGRPDVSAAFRSTPTSSTTATRMVRTYRYALYSFALGHYLNLFKSSPWWPTVLLQCRNTGVYVCSTDTRVFWYTYCATRIDQKERETHG